MQGGVGGISKSGPALASRTRCGVRPYYTFICAHTSTFSRPTIAARRRKKSGLASRTAEVLTHFGRVHAGFSVPSSALLPDSGILSRLGLIPRCCSSGSRNLRPQADHPCAFDIEVLLDRQLCMHGMLDSTNVGSRSDLSTQVSASLVIWPDFDDEFDQFELEFDRTWAKLHTMRIKLVKYVGECRARSV